VTEQYQLAGGTAAEISASVETGVRDGRLAPGAPLPTVRALATELGVSPATVASAYRTLRERGLIETAGRGGTRVRARPPVSLRSSWRLRPPPGALDLASGAPDAALLPSLRGRGFDAAPVNYGQGGPLPELLSVARERLAADGVPAEHLTVTGGALDAIERMLTAHVRPGDRVAVEDPGWSNLLDLIAALGLTPVPVPVDADGPAPEGLRRALASGAVAVVITSRAQNPTGAVVTSGRSAALRKVLQRYPQTLVIEDDHAAELALQAAYPLAGATPSWAYVRSVSKPFGPDLRLAVVAGDETSIARVAGRMRLGAGWVSTILQHLVLALWLDPAVAAQVAEARQVYAARRTALRDALGDPAPSGDSGINLWIPVADETRVVTALREEGLAVAPGSLFRLVSGPAIRVTTAALPVSQAPRVAAVIQRATHPAMQPAWR
jgi:DNA-binding transcriptional MocR family regulator